MKAFYLSTLHGYSLNWWLSSGWVHSCLPNLIRAARRVLTTLPSVWALIFRMQYNKHHENGAFPGEKVEFASLWEKIFSMTCNSLKRDGKWSICWCSWILLLPSAQYRQKGGQEHATFQSLRFPSGYGGAVQVVNLLFQLTKVNVTSRRLRAPLKLESFQRSQNKVSPVPVKNRRTVTRVAGRVSPEP